MKNFLKQITHNPYVDWSIICFFALIGIIIAALWAFLIYQNVNIQDSSSVATSSPKISIDIKKLDAAVKSFENKKSSVIDVRDPSL